MSADELHEAAERERKEWGGSVNARLYPQASAIHLALADWLDEVHGWIEEGVGMIPGGNIGDAWIGVVSHAKTVARAINGTAA